VPHKQTLESAGGSGLLYHMSMPISRRSFLTTAAAATAASLHASALPVVGVQLYTVRRVLPKKPLETLRAIEAIGYSEVECTAEHLDDIWPSLKQTSLKAVSVHLNEQIFIHQPEKLPAALDDAKKHGFEYVVCPWIEPRDRGGVEMIRKLGQTLNHAGELANKAGMHLCYHNHAFEYQPTPDGRLLDVLLKTTDPTLVSLELDVMWAQVAGVDPVSVLKQYGDRIPLVHLKNVATGTAQRFNEEIPSAAFHDLSNGAVDIPAVLRAAKQAGVKHYFVEQDETPGDPLDSLRKSFQYLESLS
jgi:sugar phosphate isomerase/epimerase